MDKNKIRGIILGAYIVSIGFIEVLNLPIVEKKIQPPELIFLVWAVFSFTMFGRTLIQSFYKNDALDKAILIYAGVMFVNVIISGKQKGWLELVGLFYLIAVFWTFRWYLQTLENPIKFIQSAFLVCGVMAGFSGMVGWIATRFGIDLGLAWPATTYYPYLGYIGRAEGFSTTPHMLHSLLTVCLFWGIAKVFSSKDNNVLLFFALALIVGGILLTFAKAMLLLIAALLVLLPFMRRFCGKRTFEWRMGVGAVLVVFYSLGTHILVVDNQKVNWNEIRKMAYAEDIPFAGISPEKSLVWTCYAINKKSSVIAGTRNFPLGVGPGGHNEFVSQLKTEGHYPSYFSNYDPHSTYFGAFAELGALGLLALLYLFYRIAILLKTGLDKANKHEKWTWTILTGCFVFAALEGMDADIMNFRHYWVLLGVLGAMASSQIMGSDKADLRVRRVG